MLSSPESEGVWMLLLNLTQNSEWLSSETSLARVSPSRNTSSSASVSINEIVGIT